MLNITIDNVLFEVHGDKVLWSPLSTAGEFAEAPPEYAQLARALVLCDFEDRGERSYVLDKALYEHFVDTHDADGNEVPEGRPSGVIFPLKGGMGQHTRIAECITAHINPDDENVIVVTKWHDPLNEVMTAREADDLFGLAEGTAKKTAQRHRIRCRKSGGTWLIRKQDAIRWWG